MNRVEAIWRSVQDIPPPFVSLYAIACGFGVLKQDKTRRSVSVSSDSKEDVVDGAAFFVQMFGAKGEMGATGTVR